MSFHTFSRWHRVAVGCLCVLVLGCPPTQPPSGGTGTGGGSGTGGGASGGGGGGGGGGGSTATWHQTAELTAPDAVPQDMFGSAAAIDGSTVIVGSSNHNNRTGAAYFYLHSGPNWALQTEVTGSDAGAFSDFGAAVSISGDSAVVGASGAGSASQALVQSGAAYVFLRTSSRWTQQQKLSASNAQSGDLFGNAVAIDVDSVAVGAVGRNSGAGTAFAFVRSGSSWTQQAELTASDAGGLDAFGSAVAISGNSVVVGAPAQNRGTGAAYVFVRPGTTWAQQQKLVAPDGAQGDLFGQAVAISGETAVIGAPGKNGQSGQAYVFVLSGSAWTLQQTLASDDATVGRQFSASVSIDVDTIAVGTPLSSTIFVFARSGTTWSHQQAIAPLTRGVSFGISTGTSQSTIVGGANTSNDAGLNAGAAYIFEQ